MQRLSLLIPFVLVFCSAQAFPEIHQSDEILETHDESTDVESIEAGLPPPISTKLIGSPRQLPPPLENIDACYPEGSGQNQYLVGYGSLMQKTSKDRTYPRTGESIPVRIYGFNRLWNCKGESTGASTTYLGTDVSTDGSSYLNAVIFKLPSASAILDYDTRELYYCRKEILPSKIQILTSNPAHRRVLTGGQFWIYVTRPEQVEAPSSSHPIVQSYVDTFLSGCIEQERLFNLTGFANECIDTTADWSSDWVNDRIFPRRPFMHQPMAGRIDRLVEEKLPEIFPNIQIEGR